MFGKMLNCSQTNFIDIKECSYLNYWICLNEEKAPAVLGRCRVQKGYEANYWAE